VHLGERLFARHRRGRLGAATEPGANIVAQRKTGVVQLAPQKSDWGTFVDTEYSKTLRGVSMGLRFQPGALVNATKIGFVQTVEHRGDAGAPVPIDPTASARMVKSGAGEGSTIDRLSEGTNPIYGANNVASNDLSDTEETNRTPDLPASYQLGHRYMDNETLKKQDAWLIDKPVFSAGQSASMVFETTAIAIDGQQKGRYYGSVRWGWIANGGKIQKIELALVRSGNPSPGFFAAASAWNGATALGTVVTVADHTQVYRKGGSRFFEVNKGQEVKVRSTVSNNGDVRNQVNIRRGKYKGQTGFIDVADLKDLGDGLPTTKLPIPAEQEEEEEADKEAPQEAHEEADGSQQDSEEEDEGEAEEPSSSGAKRKRPPDPVGPSRGDGHPGPDSRPGKKWTNGRKRTNGRGPDHFNGNGRAPQNQSPPSQGGPRAGKHGGRRRRGTRTGEPH
jgi:hypothetical protein